MAFRGLLVAAALAAAAADNAGIQLALSNAGIDYVVSQVLPVLEAKLETTTIAGTSGEKDGFDYSISDIKCPTIAIGSAVATFNPPNQAGVVLNNLNLQCSASWSFKLHIWPHIPDGSGTVDITVSDTSATVDVAIGETSGHAVLTAGASSISIGKIDLSFHGSNWDGLLNLFQGLIDDLVKDGVNSAFPSIIKDFVSTDANAELAKIPTALPIKLRAPYNISEIRFGLVAPPTSNGSYIGVGLQGDIVPLSNPVAPPIAPPSLPPFSPAAAAYFVEAHLSAYTFLSATYVYITAAATNWKLLPSQVPLGFNSTGAYLLVAPGLPLAYPGRPVTIDFGVDSMPSLAFQGGGISLYVPAQATFLVTASNGSVVPAFTLNLNATLAMDLTAVKDANATVAISGQLSLLSVTLSVASSNVGSVTVSLLNDVIAGSLQGLVIPTINAIIQPGIPLPQVDGLAFTNVLLDLTDDFVAVGLDFSYTPSPSAHATSGFGAILQQALLAERAAVPQPVPAPKAARKGKGKAAGLRGKHAA